MNEFKPTFGIEPTDDYTNAKPKLLDFSVAYRKLSSQEKERFAKEIISGITQSELS